MPRIIAASHAFPSHLLTQQEAKELIKRVFQDKLPGLEKLLTVFDNSRIEKRQLVMPAEWYLQTHSGEEKNRIFLEQGYALLCKAAEHCLSSAACSADEIDHIICVNSTGHATPTLDARLIDTLGLPRQTSRLPIWGLGCAAGAAGLSRAFDYCRAYPKARVLLAALECCSLTFMSDDLTRKNLIGTSLFADGAAAVLVTGDEVNAAGPQLLTTGSYLFPDSTRIMGWDFVAGGMQLVLSPRLPALIRTSLRSLVDNFLHPLGLKRSAIKHYLAHPGGAKVIDAYGDALGLTDEDLLFSAQLLRDQGNISSVSVLVVLEKWLASARAGQPGHGLISAFGPGFSAEMLLFKV